MDEVLEQKVPSAPNQLPKIVWYAREFFAIFLWAFAFIKLLIADVDRMLVGILGPSYNWVLDYKFFLLLGILLVALLCLPAKALRGTVFYLVFYPLILICWRLPRFLLRNWVPALIFAPSLYSFLGSLKSWTIRYSLGAIATLIILTHPTEWCIWLGMIILMLLMIWHYVRLVKIVYVHESIFSKAASVIRDRWTGSKAIATLTSQSKDIDQKELFELQSMYTLCMLIKKLALRIQRLERSHLMDLSYVVSLLYTVVLTQIVFAISYFGLSLLSQSAFDPHVNDMFTAYFLSVETLFQRTAANLPVSLVAHLYIDIEVFCSWLILVIIVSLLITTKREKTRLDIAALVNQLQNESEALGQQILKQYALTLSAAAVMLRERTSGMTKFYDFLDK